MAQTQTKKLHKTHVALVKNLAEIHGNAEAREALFKHIPADELKKNIGDYAMDERIIDQKAREIIMYMWQTTPIMGEFSQMYTRDRATKIPLGITEKEFLISTERMGRQLRNDEKQTLGAINSFDVYCEQLEAQWDIKVGDLIYNLGSPNFMEQLEKTKYAEIANEIARLAAYGSNRNATSFRNLLYGFPHRLKTMNGKNTFSAQSDELVGKNGFLMTPIKIDVGNTHEPANILTIMNNMIRRTESQYHAGAKFLMSREDASDYADIRATPAIVGANELVGVNVGAREMWMTTGQVPMWKGFPVIHCEHMHPVRTDGVIIFGNLKNLTVVNHERVDITREYKARMEQGGNGYEFSYIFFMNFLVTRPFAMTVAFRNAGTEAPVIMAGTGAKPEDGEVPNGGSINTAESGGTATVYPYCDTVGAEVFYAAVGDVGSLSDYDTAVAAKGTNTFKIDPSDPATALSEGTYVFRAFKDGVTKQSGTVTITVTDDHYE